MYGVLTNAVMWWVWIQCVGDVLMVWHAGWNIFKYHTFPFNVFCAVLFNPLFAETTAYFWILCFVDHASRYNRVKKNRLDAQLILSIFRKHLHVSGISRPIIRSYNHMYTTVGTYYPFYMIVCCPGWIGTPIQPCRGWRNILRISCASSQFFFTHLFLNFFYVDHVHSILGCIGFKFQCPWLWLPSKHSDSIFLLYCSINLLFSN
jgi:hypothetical protein